MNDVGHDPKTPSASILPPCLVFHRIGKILLHVPLIFELYVDGILHSRSGLGILAAQPPQRTLTSDQRIMIERLAYAMHIASRLSFNTRCLSHAKTGQRILARAGIPSSIKIGVVSLIDSTLCAHAWLVIGEQEIGGKLTNDMVFYPSTPR